MTTAVAIVIVLMCMLIGWRIGLIAKERTMGAMTKQCTHCLTRIKKEATVCRHCGKDPEL
jgi:hypothetical protein